MEAQELTIESGSVRIAVRAPASVAWEVARAAFEAAETTTAASPIGTAAVVENGAPSANGRGRMTKADYVRAAAYTLLSDGKWHERREIIALVRGEGITGQTVVTSLKGRFEERKDERGRVSYRDKAVTPGMFDSEEDRRDHEDMCAYATKSLGGKPDITYFPEDNSAH